MAPVVGIPELFVLLLVSLVFWVVPLAAGVWALVTLARLRRGQEELLSRGTSLEAHLRGVGR